MLGTCTGGGGARYLYRGGARYLYGGGVLGTCTGGGVLRQVKLGPPIYTITIEVVSISRCV